MGMKEGKPQLRGLHKALADPLRVRLWEYLWVAARSARELSDLTGVQVNRLYHHLGQLVDAGLLEVVAYRPLPQGKVERVYGVPSAEPAADDPAPEDIARLFVSILQVVQADVISACEAKTAGARRDLTLSNAGLRLSQEALATLKGDIEQAVERARTLSGDGPYVRVLWALVDVEDRRPTPATP